jgi:hypothetical protein
MRHFGPGMWPAKTRAGSSQCCCFNRNRIREQPKCSEEDSMPCAVEPQGNHLRKAPWKVIVLPGLATSAAKVMSLCLCLTSLKNDLKAKESWD